MANEKICAAIGCKEPATRVVHGRDYCRLHREGSQNGEVPIVACAVAGCVSPAVRRIAGRNFCNDHAPHAEHGRIIFSDAA